MLIGIVLVLLAVVGSLLYYLFMSPTSQLFGPYPWHAHTDEKVVALTFDDGPNDPYTTELADYLAAENIKATFFQVGVCVKRHPETSQRIFKDGHDIGNHSVHHRFRDHLLHPKYVKEIVDNQKIIAETIGVTPALFRSPWLWRQPWLFSSVKATGLRPVSGKFCHNFEVFQPDAQRIARKTMRTVRPGAIIIFHDGFDGRGGNRSQTVEAVKLVVTQLKHEGYRFVRISELLGVPAYQ